MVLTREQLDQMLGAPRSTMPAHCLFCGYDLTGTVSSRCPECGENALGEASRQRAVQLRRQMRVAADTAGTTKTAAYVAGAAFLLGLLGVLPIDSCIIYVLRTCALVGGVAGALLGIGTFRIGALPAWLIREKFIAPPRYTLAILAILFGVLAVGTALLLP